MTDDTTATAPALTGERADLLEALERHRWFLLQTVQGLDDDQARLTPTVSALSLGGLVKHVALTTDDWLDFIAAGGGGEAWEDGGAASQAAQQAFLDGHRLLPDETLAGVLAGYEEVAARAAGVVRTVDLDEPLPLPEAPWFEPGAVWTARRVLLHVLAETAQHAGHADIIRESIDGQKTMG